MSSSQADSSEGGGTAADVVFQSLYERILDGEVPPGARLREVELTRWYGVSRTPVREALTRLVSAGVALRQAGGGVVTATQPLDGLLDALRIFEVLEGLAARLAVERAGPRGTAALRQSLRVLDEKLKADDVSGFLDETINFNETMWGLADCEQLLSMIRVVGISNQRLRSSTLRVGNRALEALAQLEILTGAIESRDAELAETTARELVRASRQLRQTAVASAESLDLGKIPEEI